jgi:site-specific recombinase XerD
MAKNRITLSQAIEGYFIAAHARRLSPGTLADYNNILSKFEAFVGPNLPLADIDAADIRAFFNSLDGLSAKTLRNHHTGLSALWTWAIKEGLLTEHILRQVDAPRPERPEIIPYTEADIKALIAATERSRAYSRPQKRRCDHARPTALRDQAILLLLVDTGLRASELCSLRLRDVDLKNQRIRVMGKGRKERLLPISPRTTQALWRYQATQDKRPDTAVLFITRSNLPMDRNGLRHLLDHCGQRAQVQGVTVHRFRHTFAIMFLRNGGQVFALQRILGHTSLSMVNRYLALAQADIENAHRDASPVSNWCL